jgi:Rrf2 family protein
MKLSATSCYALRALIYLAGVKDNRPVASHVVAQACGAPERFLVKILSPLVGARLLYSLRGPNGGYRLARPAKGITVLEIVEAASGPVNGLAPALETADSARLDGQLAAICEQAAETYRRQLSKVRLSDLVK